MSIEQLGTHHFVVSGKGLIGEGKTRHKAIEDWIKNVREMKSLYKAYQLKF